MCRYVYHTLKNSRNVVDTIEEADVVYVYDYCYIMWMLSDHHAKQHWWLKQNYEPHSGTPKNLLSVYRQAPFAVYVFTCKKFTSQLILLDRICPLWWWLGHN